MQAKTVAILESRLGKQLGELVEKRGGRPFHAPALAEIPDVDGAYIARLIEDLEARPAQFAIFQTGVGIGLEARPPKLGPLITALDAALSR